jgi:hypothetical protein
VQRRSDEARQNIRPLCDPESEGHPSADLTHGVVIDMRSPQAEVDCDIVLHLPDRPDQRGTGAKQANLAFVKDFGDGPHHPVVRTLDDGVQKIIGVLLAGKLDLSIEVHRRPVPALRDDAGKDCSSPMFVIDSRQQEAEFGCDTGPELLLQAALAQHTFEADGSAREYLAARADFLGAIRLPDDAFKDQGTTVVADIVFLRKRHPGEGERHAGDWLNLSALPHDGETRVNAWFAGRPDMVMGEFAIGRGRYGRNTLKVEAPADYEDRLFRALRRLPEGVFSAAVVAAPAVCPPVPVPAGLGEGSFLIEDGKILQIECGQILPVMHGQTALRAGEGKIGRRLAALIGLRDRAREVLVPERGMAGGCAPGRPPAAEPPMTRSCCSTGLSTGRPFP